MTQPSQPQAPVPYAPPSGTPAIVCPYCHSTQFFGEKKVSGTGWILFWTGIAIIVISIPLMVVMGLGFCTVWFGVPLLLLPFFLTRYVNVCAACRRQF